jgi:hypothetical protein
MLDNLVVIQYKGGRCGEFLTGYLSQHADCKSVDYVWNEKTNTYNVHDELRNYLKHLYTVDIELVANLLNPDSKNITSTYYSSSRDQLLEKVNLFKQVFLENSASVFVSHSSNHNIFFDCMLMIKHWFKIMPTGNKRWRDEFKDCNTVIDFLDVTGLSSTGESSFNKFLISGGIPVLDLDQLFFDKNYSIWLELLTKLNIEPRDDFEKILSEYHSKNMDLAEKCSIPLGVNTDDQWFKEWCLKHG